MTGFKKIDDVTEKPVEVDDEHAPSSSNVLTSRDYILSTRSNLCFHSGLGEQRIPLFIIYLFFSLIQILPIRQNAGTGISNYLKEVVTTSMQAPYLQGVYNKLPYSKVSIDKLEETTR
eukprot:455305-Amorphochlora_amoeboformis.AAC.2